MIKLKRGEWAVAIFTILYVLAFAIYYISIKNYEFMWYIGVLLFFFVLIFATIRKSNFDLLILWGLSVWGFLHMCGGGLNVGGDVLYNLVIIPLISLGENTILKFDQFVHFFGFGVTALVAYHILNPYLNEKVNYKIIYPMIIAVAMGLGALNEIVEFFAVVSFPNTNVGGYYNTAIDLVFNTLGAIAAVFVIHFRRKKQS